MPINTNNYELVKNESSLKIHKNDITKFLFDFRLDGKRYRKQYSIQAKDWKKKDCINDAKKALLKYREDIEGGMKVSLKTTLNQAFTLFLETLPNTRWTKERERVYSLYIKPKIGTKNIHDVKPSDIKRIISTMDKKGLKPNTQKKILAVLKPLYKSLMEDKAIKEDPTSSITIKVPSTKKPVTNATELYKKIYSGIRDYYKDNPFYQALFLFIMYGRRKDEVLSLMWHNLDFTNNYYWIEDTKNKDKQQYALPQHIKEQLLLIKDNHKGLVFKSPVTGKKLADVKRQANQVKKHLNMPEFHFHYMRNVLVSMLAEQKTEAVILSGILGHRDITTVNKYLSINHLKSSEVGLSKIDEVIDVDISNNKELK